MGVRRQGREFALQALYLSDLTKLTSEEALRRLQSGEKLNPKAIEFAQTLIQGTEANKKDLDTLIKKFSQNWDIKRMANLDRNILRLGTYELLHEKDTPVSVIIDEAVEIAKTYSTNDSGKFVNGILDKIKNNRQTDNNENGKS